MAEPTPSLIQFFPPPEISSFWGTSIAITPSWTQEVLLTPAGRKYLTGSSLLTSSLSMTLTHPLFYIAPLAVAPFLTFPLLPLRLPFLAHGRCFRTWVLTTSQFFYLSLSLRFFAPTSVLLPSIFRKLAGMILLPTLTPTVLLQRNTRLSLSSAAALFTSLAMNAAKSSISFGRIKRHPTAWWSAEVEEAVSERRKAFAAAHRSDVDRQAYISASRRASSVIAEAKAEAWQTTCTSLSPKSNPKSVYSLLCSIACSSSSSSSFPNFPNSSSPRESASVYAAYLRSHFSVSQPKALLCVAEPGATSLSFAEPRALRNLTGPFALPSLPLNFMRLPPTFPPPLPLAQTKLPIPCKNIFLALAWIFFFTSSTLQEFAFLSFHQEDIFYYSYTQDGKTSRLSCFLPAYLSHLLRIKAV